MEEKEKFEANKLHNARFLRALGVLMTEKRINQAQAAMLLNTKSGTFSDYKKGKKRASQDMYDRLDRAFDGRLNIHYLTGESEYMMLANVPDKEIVEYSLRDGNPDYDVIQRNKNKENNDDRQQRITSRAGSIQMAVLGHLVQEPERREDIAADDDPRPHLPTWADTLVGILSKQIAENEVLHAELRQSIAEVSEMKKQLSDLLNKTK